MKMKPLLNPDHPPRGDMFEQLNWLETLCRMRGVSEISEDDVLGHLINEGRVDLAKAFVTDYFLPAASE